ncbi:MAG: hypothetical protein KGZ25_01330 [Planctomycetes bacterium]|nr:hypothetical protein [Planctomycetota bacterium]
MYDVIGIGCCALDIVLEAHRLPAPDEKLKAEQIRLQGGGLVATALVAVSRLGGCAAWIGSLGTEPLGEIALRQLSEDGVDCSHVRRVGGQSVLTAAVIADSSSGCRSILWTDQTQPQTLPSQITPEIIGDTKVLHIDNFQPEAALKAARIARDLGRPVTVDLEPGGESPDRLLEVVDYAIVPRVFAENRYDKQDPEQLCQLLYEEIEPNGAKAAVITDGDGGSWCYDGSAMARQPAYDVEVIDTTGCGDVYHGAFALSLAEGRDLEETLRFASATSALKCRQLGGRAGIPTREELERFLQGNPPERTPQK